MKMMFVGGVVLAALFDCTAAFAQSAAPAAPVPAVHRGRGYFARNESRADVQKHVEKMFARLDLNRDGFVTKDELASAEARAEAKRQEQAPKRAAKLFARLDGNHDGQITLAEVQAAHAARYKGDRQPDPARPVHSRLFDRADTNKDGVVTRAEFDAAMSAGQLHFRAASMRGGLGGRMFETADTDKDGRVSLAEAQQLALQHFDAADLNRDGVLTPDERREARELKRTHRRRS